MSVSLTFLTCNFLETDSTLVNILPPTSDPDFLDTDKGDLAVRQPAQIAMLSEVVGPGTGESSFHVVGVELFCFVTSVFILVFSYLLLIPTITSFRYFHYPNFRETRLEPLIYEKCYS